MVPQPNETMMLGIGIGLTNAAIHNQNTRLAQDHAKTAELSLAIRGRRLIEATYEGKRLVLAPYALSRSEQGNVMVLSAVVLRSSNTALNAWEPQIFEVQKINQEKARAESYLPSQAFDPSVYGDRLILAVDLS